MRAGRPLTVVKLGGSLAFSPHLRGWLDAIRCGTGHIVLVPGGGPFADAVRAAQPSMGFDDGAAHHMALLAMAQYGVALVSLGDQLQRADSADIIRAVLREGKVAVWSPMRMVLGASDIPASWDMTSDSLAAWVAGKIGAARLLLIKSVPSAADSIFADDLTARGIVDPMFPGLLDENRLDAAIVGPDAHAAARAAFERGERFGSRIVLRAAACQTPGRNAAQRLRS